MWMTCADWLTTCLPQHHQIYLSLCYQPFVPSYPSDAGTITNGECAHFKIRTPAQTTPCLVQRRVAVFFEIYRAHVAKYFDDQFC